MFISATINEVTREIKWDKSQVAAVDGDYAVNGFKLTCLGLDPDYNLTTGTWYAVFTAQDGTSHSNPLTVSGGVVTWEFDNNINKGGSGVVKFFLYAVTANTAGKILKRWDSAITDLRVAGTIDYENREEEAARESEIDRLAGLVVTLTATAATINDVKAVLSRITNSSPVVVGTVADLSGLDVTEHQLAIVRADGYLYYYDGAAWQQGIKYGSYELDTTLTESGKAADAAAVGAEISQVKEDLSAMTTATAEDAGKALLVKTVSDGKVTEWEFEDSSDDGIKALTERYIELTPEYKVVDGHYRKKDDKMVLHAPSRFVSSVMITQKIHCKPGDMYQYTGQYTNSIPGGFYFLDDTCVGTVTTKNYICTIPDGVNAVVFQSYAAPDNTPSLTIKRLHPALLSDVRGESSGEIGQIWMRTEDGSKWANNPEQKNTERLKEDVAMLHKVTSRTMNGFSYSLYEGGGHRNYNGKLAWMNFANANSYFTELIPCYAGQQFLMMGGVTGGNAFQGAFFIDQDKETIIGSRGASTAVAVCTIPEGASYVAFQSSWTPTASIPTFYVEEYSIVRDYRNIRPLDGVKMTLLGDSISMPSNASYVSYIDMLKNDGVEVANLAKSGTGIAVGYGSETNYYGRLSKIPSDVGFIVVSGSFNDLNRGPSLGTIDDEGTTTIAGYMNQLFSALLESFPTVPMLIITTHPWSYYKPGTEKSDAYVDMLRQMGLKYGIPFYSLYDKTNLRPWIGACNTKFFRNGGDGVHPNTYGHAQLYALLRPVFIKMCYQTSNFLVPGKAPVELNT